MTLAHIRALCVAALVLTGCGGTSSPETSPAKATSAAGRRFDVGDHELYLKCEGSGSPTVVYLHGFIADPTGGGSQNADRIPSLLRDRSRVCIYDRANVGRSGKVAGRLTGADAIRDLHRLRGRR
jgi:pimeloyl-ACP methyl ester carboxylesterase